MNILILGCGQLGSALAKSLASQGHQVTAVSRQQKPEIAGVTHVYRDIQQLQATDFNQVFDWVYVILSADQRDIVHYQQSYIATILPIYQALHYQPIQRIVYISSTRVYGECLGQWIDDNDPPCPDDELGECLLQAENLWQHYWQQRLIIVRPSGILRSIDYWQKLAINLTEIPTLHWLNFIKQADLVQFLIQLLTLNSDQYYPSYIASDQPILRHEFLNQLRLKLGLAEIQPHHNLTKTGKRLIAKRFQDVLNQLPNHD